jgi:excisionase family DNA binding protein
VSGPAHNFETPRTAAPPIRTPVPTDAVFTIDELAVYLKLPKRTLYKLAQEGSVPGHKVGRHWRFHRDVIDRWLGKTG